METWHGRRAGQLGAVEDYAADDAFPIDDIDDDRPEFPEAFQAIVMRQLNRAFPTDLNSGFTQHPLHLEHNTVDRLFRR